MIMTTLLNIVNCFLKAFIVNQQESAGIRILAYFSPPNDLICEKYIFICIVYNIFRSRDKKIKIGVCGAAQSRIIAFFVGEQIFFQVQM